MQLFQKNQFNLLYYHYYLLIVKEIILNSIYIIKCIQ